MDSDQDLQELGEHLITIEFKISIEDVTPKVRDEFVKRLTDPGNEIELRLSDGHDYVATVQVVDYIGVVE